MLCFDVKGLVVSALNTWAGEGLVVAERAGLGALDSPGALAVLVLEACRAGDGEALAGSELLAGGALAVHALASHE